MYQVNQMKYLQGEETAFCFVNVCVSVHTHVCICVHSCWVWVSVHMCWEERRDWLYKMYLSLSFFYKANHYAWKLFLYVSLIFLNPWHFNDLLTTSRRRAFAGWGRVSVFSVFHYAFQPVFGRVASLAPAWKLGLSCPCSLRLPAPCV